MKSIFEKIKKFMTVGKFATIMMILGILGIAFMYCILKYTRILTVPVFLICVLGIFALAISEIYCAIILVRYMKKKREMKRVSGSVYKNTNNVKNKDRVLSK